jgi:hypothetical protein
VIEEGAPQAAQRTPGKEGQAEFLADVDLGRLLRKAGLDWFCTLASASPSTACAVRICMGLALERPTISTLPLLGSGGCGGRQPLAYQNVSY